MTREQQQAWIEQQAPAALAAQRKWGVPASVTLAQAILESSDGAGNWGGSKLAVQCCNFFGVKARPGEDYTEFLTTEFSNKPQAASNKPEKQLVLARFRRYASVEESFDAHGRLLGSLARYRPAMAVAHDPIAFAEQLQRCGYSTNPKYAELLTSLICRFDLTRFDSDESLKPQATSDKLGGQA
jgi:flagellum-specific peptidoglycan hydrolase FlgJ